jgi:hypothetical protein
MPCSLDDPSHQHNAGDQDQPQERTDEQGQGQMPHQDPHSLTVGEPPFVGALVE